MNIQTEDRIHPLYFIRFFEEEVDSWSYTGRWRIVNGQDLYIEVEAIVRIPTFFSWKTEPRLVWVHEQKIHLADILGPIQECSK